MSGEPILLQVIVALADALRPIQFYSAKLGETIPLADRVSVGRSQLSPKTDPVPCLTVTEAPEQDMAATANAGQQMRFEKLYFITGFAPRDPTGPVETAEAYALQADVLRRIGRALKIGSGGAPMYPDEYMLGMPKSVQDIRTTIPLVLSPERGVLDAACFYLPVLVDVVIDPFEPTVP